MIRKILTCYAARLEEYLGRTHRKPEGLATVGMIGSSAKERPNKMVVSLLNVEREPVNGGYIGLRPPLQLNLYVILAAVFDEQRYAESLSLLSDTLGFIQSTPRFEVDGRDYTIEMVNSSMQELSHIWPLLGGQYYPSVVCKIRRLTIDKER